MIEERRGEDCVSRLNRGQPIKHCCSEHIFIHRWDIKYIFELAENVVLVSTGPQCDDLDLQKHDKYSDCSALSVKIHPV